MTTSRTLTPEPLTESAWKPFGWLPVEDTDPRDGQHRLAFEWADAHVNRIHHNRDEAPATSSGLLCEMMFHHVTHTQALLVLNCPAVLAVAPAGTRFDDPADLDLVQAFLLQPLDALVLDRAVWHWGPFPQSEPRVDLYNVQGLRYAEDNTCVRFDERGYRIEVLTSP
jgi:ureidoglycolate hydrolase